tara:strand:- start:296 stop:577 length:282 start_codon:yes stop_codon:yes gene_type:complete
MTLPKIKPETCLAVVEKAMQSDPVEYCGKFLEKERETAEVLSGLAVGLAQNIDSDLEAEELIMRSTMLSAAMFMTCEMVKAEIEAKELEELIG